MILQDVQYGDIDYMESKLDFTVDPENYKGLSEFVNEIHNMGMKYIVIQVIIFSFKLYLQ